jgi:hypothetical protein
VLLVRQLLSEAEEELTQRDANTADLVRANRGGGTKMMKRQEGGARLQMLVRR